MQITFGSTWISRFSFVIFLTISLLSTSCKNLFSELAKSDSDAAIFYSARQLSNARLYDDAINKIYELSDEYYQRRDVQVFLASAFAGKCGLDFLSFAQSVANNPTNATPMELALVHMKDVSSEVDCQTAETIMRAVSPAGDGVMSDSIDDALYMAFISLAKIGAILSRIADTGAGNPDNDGAVDAGYNACAMADADAREIGTGITLLYNNIILTSSDFATAMDDMATVCGVAGATCAKTDPTAFTAPELVLLKGVVDFQDFGVGSDAVYPSCP
jgi:hypothetical protein